MTQLLPLNAAQIQAIFDNWIGLDHFFSVPVPQKPNFPPYNTIKVNDNHYVIEMALAGYKREDIKITQIEDKLVVESVSDIKSESETDVEYIHRGIAKRSFKTPFNLGPDIIVDGAELNDGMLAIYLHREIPEAKLPRSISIGQYK